MILSVGIVPIRKHQSDWQFLLLRCFNYWDFPKGEMAHNESPLKTALRELQEETTLQDIQLKWGETYYETAPYSRQKVARYYLGEVEGNHSVYLQPNPENGIVEHHEFRWVSYHEGLKLTGPRIQKVLEWAKEKL